MSVYISIGRNIGSEPMPLDRWADFQYRVKRAVVEFAGPCASHTVGEGYYEGSAEQTAVIVGAADPHPHKLSALKIALRALAREYEQECIALTVAPVEFV